MNKTFSKTPQPTKTNVPFYEAEVADGLEAVARDEIQAVFGKDAKIRSLEQGAVRFTYIGKPQKLFGLQTVIAVYASLYFEVPRPRALLGHEHFQAMLRQIAVIRALSPKTSYSTFHLSAAGSDSSVMQRLKEELAKNIGLMHSDDKGDLFMRLRRSGQGWEMLMRLTSRPLATRNWRVCNYEGALNASVARAMVLLTKPTSEDVFVNLACGSGSLLVERLEHAPVKQALGFDIDLHALACARQNLTAARKQAALFYADAGALPLSHESVDVLCADLPFGSLVGTHHENIALYPRLLFEAARVAKHGARFVLITHEIRLMEGLLRESNMWDIGETLRITLGGLHPRIYVLRRL
jgi:23S rRNA G2445 N2-methylase RlmL